MSQTKVCLATAASLTVLALLMAVVRHRVMGDEISLATGRGSYQVTLLVRGRSTGKAKLITACPLRFHRQYPHRESYVSSELTPSIHESDEGAERNVTWTQPVSAAEIPFRARYSVACNVSVHLPTREMTELKHRLYRRPKTGEHVGREIGINPGHEEITNLAMELTYGIEREEEKVRALFRYVDQVLLKERSSDREPHSALECLQLGRGDALAKSRLLIALCRNRGMAARLVHGLALDKDHQQHGHVWVEAWVEDHWMPMCPYYHYCGRVPASYLVFGFGHKNLVQAMNLEDLEYVFLVDDGKHQTLDPNESSLHRCFSLISLHALPPATWRLVEFLLLLPVAVLIICVYRNLIGMPSFGTYAPALIGLAFREAAGVMGIVAFVSLVLLGWGLRRMIDHFHLLQVPRTAFLLSVLVVFLLGVILFTNHHGVQTSQYLSLVPLIILTGMIERFWTLEAEDSTAASFRTLLGTMAIALTIGLVLSWDALVRFLVDYPEMLGIVMAVQLVIGRYTGYRLSELFRFRDFVEQPVSRL